MLRTLNSTRTGSARPSEYTILYSGGHYRIYDKQQRFRCEFATLPAAQAYIASRTAAAAHNNALADGASTGSAIGQAVTA